MHAERSLKEAFVFRALDHLELTRRELATDVDPLGEVATGVGILRQPRV